MSKQDYVHSGYYSIFRPPYSLNHIYHHSSIYCVSSRFNAVMIIIPLVQSFTKDVIDIAERTPARTIYLVAPDIGVGFISDYHNSWKYIKYNLRKECKIFTKFMPENYINSDFKADIIRTENDNLSIDIPRSNLDVGTIDITFSKQFVCSSAPFACDIILNDTYKTRYFVSEINEHKAKYLYENKDSFDEIHIAYITSNYGGWTYQELMKKYPILVSKIYCNLFGSYEEYTYAKSKNIRVGGAYNNDFI